MARMFALPPLLVLGLVGCAATDPSSEPSAADPRSGTESSAVTAPPVGPHSCVQITQPRFEFWSEFPPEPGDPTPRDWYKTCTTQPDCSRVCEGEDVVPSVYSWHLTIRCTQCT
jgi:hypothetical protein